MDMHCDGCPQRAEKLLKKLNGIESVTWDLKEQLIFVKVAAGVEHKSEELLATIQKTGKTTSFVRVE